MSSPSRDKNFAVSVAGHPALELIGTKIRTSMQTCQDDCPKLWHDTFAPWIHRLYPEGNCPSWNDVHTALAVYGMEIKRHGNGMVIKDRYSERSNTMKASSLDKSLSRGKLETRFGEYEPPKRVGGTKDSAPPHRSPERGALYAEYREGKIQVDTCRFRLGSGAKSYFGAM